MKNIGKSRKIALMFSLGVLVSLGGCEFNRQIQSKVDGATLEEIEKSGKVDIAPKYDLLKDLTEIKVAVFVTKDDGCLVDMYKDINDKYESASEGVVQKKADCSGDATSNQKAEAAISQIKNWVNNKDASKTFLKEAVEKKLDAPKGVTAFEITGKGPALGIDPKEQKTVKYVFSFYLGMPKDLTNLFGKALAVNNITFYNGHFYRLDIGNAMRDKGLALASTSTPTPTSTPKKDEAKPADDKKTDDQKRDESVKKDEVVKQEAKKQTSIMYGPAMDIFTQEAKKNELQYRIVVFNGCFSEYLEKLVVATAKDAGQPNIDIVGHRGKNSYGFMGTQDTRFMVGLAKKYTWPTMLRGLCPNEKCGTVYNKYDQNKVIPVVSTSEIGR
ncbi:MAG: hypothetical protein HQK54_12460 [Oligoflexales bacterium]|nr:hypothetical protein [Oligoflexales bacterium]